MKARRMQALVMSADPMVQEVVRLPSFQKELKKWEKPVEYRGLLAVNATMRRQAFAHHLHASVDGKGLRHASLVPSVHSWVDSGTSLMSGAKFNASLGVRLNTLPTRLRAARGREDARSTCDCCGPEVKESLSHILQSCPRTKGARIKRHDRILDQSRRIFRRLGYTVQVELSIPTSAGLRKPDMLVYGEGKSTTILDACIVSDMYDDLNTPHQWKIDKYSGHEEIHAGVERLAGTRPDFGSICISWRGVFSPASAAHLRRLGMTQADLGLLSAITVEQGAIVHRLFNDSTVTTNHPL